MIPHIANLSREERRAALRQLERDNAKHPAQLADVPEPWEPPCADWLKPIRVMRSREFLVQIFRENEVVRISVNRTSVDEKTLRWRDDISWDELQRLKGEAGYGRYEAVEVYPPEGCEINVANMRHLWILEGRLPFSWGPH